MTSPNLLEMANSRRSEAHVREARKLHLRPVFRVGQVWATIEGPKDAWTIVAVSDHPDAPVIAQSRCGSVREFSLTGVFGGENSDPDDLDLVTLISEA